MINTPIILAPGPAVLAWVFAAARVDAGGRKFGHGCGDTTAYLQQREGPCDAIPVRAT